MADVTLGVGRPLRVFTANINAEYPPYESRLPLLRETILALDPDLLAFQEAGAYASEGDHQVSRVLDGLDYHIRHQFDGLATLPRRDGNCIASRWPFEWLETLDLQLSPRAMGYPLAAMAVRVAIPGLHPGPDGAGALFVNTKPSW